MRTITPLRYPGGKACLAPALSAVMDAQGLVRPVMAEPFAGAAGASLELLLQERVDSILINDLDFRIYAFWWAVLNRTDEILRRVADARLNIREWKRQRTIYRSARRHPWVDVGFATFYLNRTNRSGILVNGGPIGGIKQKGQWGLDARYTAEALVDRVARIAMYRERIRISNLDGVEFLKKLELEFAGRELFVYLDPPYYVQGAHLYHSTFKHEDHVAIGKAVRSSPLKHWVVTYDDVPAIRAIYRTCQVSAFRLRYTAQRRRRGAELFITPKRVATPTRQLKAV